jgi:hypothetical protein
LYDVIVIADDVGGTNGRMRVKYVVVVVVFLHNRRVSVTVVVVEHDSWERE